MVYLCYLGTYKGTTCTKYRIPVRSEAHILAYHEVYYLLQFDFYLSRFGRELDEFD